MKKAKTAEASGAFSAYIPVDADFRLRDNAGEIAIDENFAAQSFGKDVLIRFFRKASAVIGLILIIVISLMAVVGPGMNEYTYSGQELSQKNLAPRIKALEKFGIFDGSESMKTTTGSMEINYYKDKYFTYDEPIPFHGLTIYPVTMRNYQQFMVSTACLTLNKNDDI